MNTIRATIRWFITASLLVGVSVTSTPGQSVLRGDGVVVMNSQPGQRLCCCGTEDGRCCGTACCQMPIPKRQNVPVSPKPAEDRGQPLGWVLATDIFLVDLDLAKSLRDVTRRASIVNGHSLIAMSVRLNV